MQLSSTKLTMSLIHSDFFNHFPSDTPESLPGKGMPESFQNQYSAEFGDHDQGGGGYMDIIIRTDPTSIQFQAYNSRRSIVRLS